MNYRRLNTYRTEGNRAYIALTSQEDALVAEAISSHRLRRGSTRTIWRICIHQFQGTRLAKGGEGMPCGEVTCSNSRPFGGDYILPQKPRVRPVDEMQPHDVVAKRKAEIKRLTERIATAKKQLAEDEAALKWWERVPE